MKKSPSSFPSFEEELSLYISSGREPTRLHLLYAIFGYPPLLPQQEAARAFLEEHAPPSSWGSPARFFAWRGKSQGKMGEEGVQPCPPISPDPQK